MKKLLSLLVALSLQAGGADAFAQAAGAFARMGFGARGIAMSNALVADAFGHASPYYNPALAPFITRQNLEASAAFLTLDRELQFLQLSTPLRPRAGIAAGLIHAGVSGIDGRDDSGYHTGEYATDEFAFFLAFGVRAGRRVTAGLGLQLFQADYFEDLGAARSIGLDVGLSVQASEALRLGLAVDDLLASYGWDTSDLYGSAGRSTTDRFPARLRLGAAFRLPGRPMLLTAEYESRFTPAEVRRRDVEVVGDRPQEDFFTSEDLLFHDSTLRLGAEYQPVEAFAVRAGVDRLGTGALGGARPSAGFMVEQGLGPLVARAEYAFVLEPYALGTMHLLTLRVFL
jgi:hypothetical protein